MCAGRRRTSAAMLVVPARSTTLVDAWLSVDHQYTLTGLLSGYTARRSEREPSSSGDGGLCSALWGGRLMGGQAMVLPAELLRSYVSGLLASRFPARPAPLDVPGMERFSAAVLFADISGFTPLAERLARRGPAGAEELAAPLNASFAGATAVIAEHRGEVITFAGDGLLAVWPATDQDDGLATATCDAGRCALAVQSALHGQQTADGLRLSLRIGVGA